MFIRTEKIRVPFQKSKFVNVYKCEICGKERRLRVNWHGSTPKGGFICGSYDVETQEICGHCIGF